MNEYTNAMNKEYTTALLFLVEGKKSRKEIFSETSEDWEELQDNVYDAIIEKLEEGTVRLYFSENQSEFRNDEDWDEPSFMFTYENLTDFNNSFFNQDFKGFVYDYTCTNYRDFKNKWKK